MSTDITRIIKKIKVNEDRTVNDYDINTGYIGENFAVRLEFEFPEDLESYNKIIEFSYGDNKSYDGILKNNIYEIKNNITQYPFVSCQLKFIKNLEEIKTSEETNNESSESEEETDVEIQVIKTNIFHLRFDSSINATEQINAEDENQEILDQIMTKVNYIYDADTDFRDEIDDLSNEVSEFSLKIGKFEIDIKQYDEDIEKLKEENITLHSKDTEIENSISDLSNKLDSIDNDITNINNDLDNIDKDISTMQSDISANSGNINNLTNRVSIVENDISSLDSDLEQAQSDISSNATAISQRALISETGKSLEQEIDSITYVMTTKLKDKNGNVLSSVSVDLPLETMVVNARYNRLTREIVLELQSGSEVSFSVADLVSGLQSEITSNNKLSSDLVDDTNNAHKFVSNTEKSTWNAKYDKASTGIPKSDLSSSVQSSLDLADTAIQEHQDLTDYVKNTDYATSNVGGVIKIDVSYGSDIASNGALRGSTRTYQQYSVADNRVIISKGTLENVITGKDLTTKAYVDGIVGNIGTLLDNVNKEVI